MPVLADVRSIDALIAGDPAALDNAGLRANLLEFGRARARLDAAEAATIGEFDQRGAFVDDGMLNTRSWLAHHTGIARNVAGGRIWTAKRLRHMPLMAAALADGAVTSGHAVALGRCLKPRTLEAFVRDEAMLVEQATLLEVDDFQRAVARWIELNDENGPPPGDEKPSELYTSPMLDGRTRIDGELDLEDSAEYLAELDAIYDELWHADQAADLTDPDKFRTPAHANPDGAKPTTSSPGPKAPPTSKTSSCSANGTTNKSTPNSSNSSTTTQPDDGSSPALTAPPSPTTTTINRRMSGPARSPDKLRAKSSYSASAAPGPATVSKRPS